MTHVRGGKPISVVAEIERLGKVARRKDLLARGCTDWGLAQATEAGHIVKVGRGYFAVPGADPLDIWLAGYQARRTCLSKAKQLGLWVIQEPALIHVAAAHGQAISGCVVHRVSGPQTIMEILRQCIQCGSELDALLAMESAVVLKHCNIPALRAEFSRDRDARGRNILAMLDPQSMSIVETIARYYLRLAGYNVQSQYFQKGVGHLDLWIDGLLGLETDGAAYHNTPDGWATDMVRDNLLTVRGMWHLRLSARMILERPELMLDWVRQTMDRINSLPA